MRFTLFTRRCGIASVLWFVALAAMSKLRAVAHEVDNFNLPLDVELADVGDFVGMMHTRALEEAVAELNSRIERAALSRDMASRERQIAHLHNPATVVTAVSRRFGDAVTETFRVEQTLRGAWGREAFPEKRASLPSIRMNFEGHLPFDPRRLVMLSQSDTMKAYGVYFGSDKLTHFHRLGAQYFHAYQGYRRDGRPHGEAMRRVILKYGERTIFSEKGMFGTFGTGVYSNADMCVNLLGFKFYQNLTAPVVLKGRQHPALLERSGVFWRLARHVRPQSGWFAPYVSDHWNEALNPSLYGPTMRNRIRRDLAENGPRIIEFYTRRDGRPANAEYFDRLARSLSTYYGEEYGHSGRFELLMNIGNTCFPIAGPKSPTGR